MAAFFPWKNSTKILHLFETFWTFAKKFVVVPAHRQLASNELPASFHSLWPANTWLYYTYAALYTEKTWVFHKGERGNLKRGGKKNRTCKGEEFSSLFHCQEHATWEIWTRTKQVPPAIPRWFLLPDVVNCLRILLTRLVSDLSAACEFVMRVGISIVRIERVLSPFWLPANRS